MADPLCIAGGGVAGLAAALIAARRGRPVDLYVEPGRIGGGFAGIRAAGRRFDLGVRLFELSYEGLAAESVPVDRFDPDGPSHRPLMPAIAAFIESVLPGQLHQVAAPEMWIAGRRIPCPLMTVDLTGLVAAVPEHERARIVTELRHLPQGPAPEMLQDASLARHGPILHTLLSEPVCAKQHTPWRETLTVLRRKLWMALFHTTTLIEAFTGQTIGFRPHRPFHSTGTGEAFPFIDALLAQLRAEPGVHLHETAPLTQIRRDGKNVTLTFGPTQISAPESAVVLALPPEALFHATSLAYAPQRVPAAILWMQVATEDIHTRPSSLLIADAAVPGFRITPAGPAGATQVFAVEFGTCPADAASARAALEQTGLVREGAAMTVLHRIAGAGQTAPTATNRAAFTTAWTQLRDRFPRLTILGGARRFGWDALNDQIADALVLGATQC